MNKSCHQSSTNCWRVDLRDGPTALTSTRKAGFDNVLTKNISLQLNSKTYCSKKNKQTNKQTNNVEHAFTCRANQTFVLKITVSRKNCRETPRQNHDLQGMWGNNGIRVPKALRRKYRKTTLFSRYSDCTDWTVRGSTPSQGERFTASVQIGSGAHSPSCTMNTRSLSRDNAAGACR